MSDKNLVNNLKAYLVDTLKPGEIGKSSEAQSRMDYLRAKIADFSSKNDIDVITKLEMKDIINRMEHTYQRLDEIENQSEELMARVRNVKNFK